jgi:hypothetical protein
MSGQQERIVLQPIIQLRLPRDLSNSSPDCSPQAEAAQSVPASGFLLSYPNSSESVDEKMELASARGTCHCSPMPGTVVRCIAPYGVAIRSGPDFSEKSKGFIRSGDTACIAEREGENWIREMDGWIPLADPRGNPLFVVENYM